MEEDEVRHRLRPRLQGRPSYLTRTLIQIKDATDIRFPPFRLVGYPDAGYPVKLFLVQSDCRKQTKNVDTQVVEHLKINSRMVENHA